MFSSWRVVPQGNESGETVWHAVVSKDKTTASYETVRIHRPVPSEDRSLVFENVLVPTPRPTEIVIRVQACAICRTDPHESTGELPTRQTPVTPGYQVAGTVRDRASATHTSGLGFGHGGRWLSASGGKEEERGVRRPILA